MYLPAVCQRSWVSPVPLVTVSDKLFAAALRTFGWLAFITIRQLYYGGQVLGLERLTKPGADLPHPSQLENRRYAHPGGSRFCQAFLRIAGGAILVEGTGPGREGTRGEELQELRDTPPKSAQKARTFLRTTTTYRAEQRKAGSQSGRE